MATHDPENQNQPIEDDDDDFGPPLPPPSSTKKRSRPKINEELYLENLPNADVYEKSFMHRDTVSMVFVSRRYNILITCSIDGHIKFWEIYSQEIRFTKHYRAHFSLLTGACLSFDESMFGSVGKDEAFKYFDVRNADMVVMLKLKFMPLSCEFVYARGAPEPIIAISCSKDSLIRLFRPTMDQPFLNEVKCHHQSVNILKYNPTLDVCISADPSGAIELWHPRTGCQPTPLSTQNAIKFELKSDTDLYELFKKKTNAISIVISPNSKYFAVMCKDAQLRIYNFSSCKICRIYDESMDMYSIAQSDPQKSQLHLEKFDLGKRMAGERELISGGDIYYQNMLFDESSQFILFPSLVGIKIVNIINNKLNCILGKSESNLRFMSIALYQGYRLRKLRDKGIDTKEGFNISLYASAFNKRRFYCFTRHEPVDDRSFAERDVINEKPSKEEQSAMAAIYPIKSNLGKEAIIHTTMGDIVVKLFPNETPRTVENFCVHSKNQYYDNSIFHRVIKGFMIQTGKPQGDDDEGESIWGGEFADEITRELKHVPFTLSMANSGPNTNGSQFFITTIPTSWLDGKHTVFGRVIRGMDVVLNIENVKTNSNDKPYEDIKILTIRINA